MRGNIIEELYYGNIDPQDRGYRPKSPVKKASDSLNDLEEKLTEQLAGENKELFLRFCNAYAEFMGESELDTFITGFRFRFNKSRLTILLGIFFWLLRPRKRIIRLIHPRRADKANFR